MKIICPACRRLVEKENINAEKDYAFCPVCQEAFMISALLQGDNGDQNETELFEKIMREPPRGTWKHEDFDKKTIGATMRSPFAFFLVPFMMVWSGGSLGGIYLTQLISGKFNLVISLIGLPFLLGSIIFWSMTVMTIAGKVEVIIGKDSYVFTGVGKLGIKKRFDWDSAVRIYEDKILPNGFFHNARYASSIFIEGKTRIKFGAGLREDRKYFLLTALKYLHHKKNYGA